MTIHSSNRLRIFTNLMTSSDQPLLASCNLIRDVTSREIAFPGREMRFPGLDRDSRLCSSTYLLLARSKTDRRPGPEGGMWSPTGPRSWVQEIHRPTIRHGQTISLHRGRSVHETLGMAVKGRANVYWHGQICTVCVKIAKMWRHIWCLL